MNLILELYGLILLGYTAWRTYDFFTLNLPSNIANEMALLGLFAFDIGLIIWQFYYRKIAKSPNQITTSVALTVIDFLGSFGSGVADMILRQTMIANYQIPPLLVSMLIYGIPAIVAANVAGVVIASMSDLDEMERRTKRIVDSQIRTKAIETLRNNAGALSQEYMETLVEELQRGVRENVMGLYFGNRPTVNVEKPEDVPKEFAEPEPLPLISSNGNGHKTNELTALMATLTNPTRARKSKKN